MCGGGPWPFVPTSQHHQQGHMRHACWLLASGWSSVLDRHTPRVQVAAGLIDEQQRRARCSLAGHRGSLLLRSREPQASLFTHLGKFFSWELTKPYSPLLNLLRAAESQMPWWSIWVSFCFRELTKPSSNLSDLLCGGRGLLLQVLLHCPK